LRSLPLDLASWNFSGIYAASLGYTGGYAHAPARAPSRLGGLPLLSCCRPLTGCTFGAPLDIVGFLGQLDSPKPQLVNNVGFYRSLNPLSAFSCQGSSLLWIVHVPSPEGPFLPTAVFARRFPSA
jgi:hypothetical protein